MDYPPLSHVTAEKADLYRSVMRAFVEAKSHFLAHLRPEDVQQQVGEAELASVCSPREQVAGRQAPRCLLGDLRLASDAQG